MYFVYQQTASYQDKYAQIATNENEDAAVAKGRSARATGGCVVVTSVDNAHGQSSIISKPTAGVVYDSSR